MHPEVANLLMGLIYAGGPSPHLPRALSIDGINHVMGLLEADGWVMTEDSPGFIRHQRPSNAGPLFGLSPPPPTSSPGCLQSVP